MADTPTPFSITSDRPAISLSAVKTKDTFTVKIRNEGIVADTVNIGIETVPGTPGPAVDPAWFTVEGGPLPHQRPAPPGTDVLVPITVTLPVGGQPTAERLEHTFRPYVWSAIRPPRETTVYGPATTLTVDPAALPPWWRRYWWVLVIAGLVLLVAIAATVIVVFADEPDVVVPDPTPTETTATTAPPEPVNEPPVARLDVLPLAPTTWDKVEADFSRSSDDSGSLSGTIDWGDGSTTGPVAPGGFGHSYAAPGTYKILVTVADGATTATDFREITVTWPLFDGEWLNPESTGPRIDRLAISGFNGQAAQMEIRVIVQDQVIGDPVIFNFPEASGALNGRVIQTAVHGSGVDGELTIEFDGPDRLKVVSRWVVDFGVLEITVNDESRLVRQ